MPRHIALNYRMTAVTAAIAGVQFRRTPGYVDTCIRSAAHYNEAVSGSALIVPQRTPPDRTNTYHLWAATYEGDRLGLSFDEFQRLAEDRGFGCMWRYIQQAPYRYEVFQEPRAFGRGCPTRCPLRQRDAMFGEGQCPNAEDIMSRLLLVWTGGNPDDHARAAGKLREAIEAAG
jgi:dTDP-4-amino-4,6-dideoxygalactose transaminase